LYKLKYFIINTCPITSGLVTTTMPQLVQQIMIIAIKTKIVYSKWLKGDAHLTLVHYRKTE